LMRCCLLPTRVKIPILVGSARKELSLAAAFPRNPAVESLNSRTRLLATSMAPKESAAKGPKLRILALHGFLQNAEVFHGRIGSIRKALKSIADIECLEAPHLITEVSSELASEAGASEQDRRGWWSTADCNQDGTKSRPALSTSYVGVDETLQLLHRKVREDGPFDGILGFSQGASAGALLCSGRWPEGLEELGEDTSPLGEDTLPLGEDTSPLGEDTSPRFKFAVLIGGFLPRDPKYAALIQAGSPGFPSLHVMGTADQMVPPARGQELMAHFKNAELFEHPGRHGIPTNAEFRNALKAFILKAVGESSNA